MTTKSTEQDSQDLVNKIVIEYLKDRKNNRRWKMIKRIIVLFLIGLLVFKLWFSYLDNSATQHVALIDLKGTIFDTEAAGADNFARSLKGAYEDNVNNLKALIIRIDSPGGSPVQADYMYNSIRYYQHKYPKIKVYAVCVDLCASAAYYVASAADEIYANPASLVGSIGVLYNGFGFVDTIKKLGVERRLMTAGKNKAFMDVFSEEKPEQKIAMQVMLDQIHKQFIDKVKQGRGNRLHINDDTFSGLFWTGAQAKEQGLIDGFASTGQLARDIIKEENIINYTRESNLFDRFSKNIGMTVVNNLPAALNSLHNKLE